MKALIFDSGALINLSMNGLLYILEELKKNFAGKFVITEDVKYEVIDHPIGIARFELGAMMIKSLLNNSILEEPEALGINSAETKRETKKIMEMANHAMQIKEKWINLISNAEASCLALSSELNNKGIESIIAIDERTTRLLCENPLELEKIMSQKLKEKVTLIGAGIDKMREYKFMRSAEIIFVAYKKGLIKIDDKKALEALLYASKYKGCAISFEEINIMKKL